METVELCRDFRREDLHGKIHHGLESRCDGERRADVRGKSVSWHGFHDPAHGVELYGGIVEQPLDMPAADHFGGRQTVKDGRIDKGYS
eukprot:1674638-Prorocentrum_lima.AAC.1